MGRRLSHTVTKEVNIDVEINIDDFETEDLLDELLLRGALTKSQHAALSKEQEVPGLVMTIAAEMEKFLWRLSLRDLDGAIHHLESAIPAANRLAALIGSR